MGKFLVRISVIGLGFYFLSGYVVAYFFGENIHSDIYVLLLEAIVVVYSYSEGKYHCRHLKHTAAAVFASDSITRVDYHFNLFTADEIFLVNSSILAAGIGISVFLSIRHFYIVNKKKKRRGRYKHEMLESDKENGSEGNRFYS